MPPAAELQPQINVNGHHHAIKNTNVTMQEVYPDKFPWLSQYPKLSDEIALEPCDYIASALSGGTTKALIDALNIWYDVPEKSLETIKNVIYWVFIGTMIMDDIEDYTDIRRGQPATHAVFGMPQAANSGCYSLVKGIFEAQKLSLSAVAIYHDELRELHVGQSLEIHYRFHVKCPSEAEYIQTIDGKTAGLFRMVSRLMRDQATQNKDLEVEELFTLIGRFYQIRNDYQNLNSPDYAGGNGPFADLDEGKYSLMLVHALSNQKTNLQLQSLLQQRSQQGSLTRQQKDLIMKIMAKSKSLEYAATALEDLYVEIDTKLGQIEAKLAKKGFKTSENRMIRAIMSRLRLSKPSPKAA
ncbi:hypothetical protein AOL_s00081g1 [Orbilia oligospora ATCC 24927]|uniref:Geranylgeranyl pyrophosphate synthetase n=1 Tax=Arthrobotrys oligospora (strain ATCC 24927 / CBS 115.81 / DSM 1491) TaxID=756982 RepID=G1XF60_ARTOA|nr:hypothetical protein AOL_s00081g1 [Orbilia oligospora ATCC 24927]EGX48138.1 hypothetical protein AOL_s00081g1 [Orbilia oligospora ATCC 24927]